MRTELRPAGAVVALLFAPAVAGAQQGYANAPFRDAPVPLAQAAALDRIAAFAGAAAVAGPAAADGNRPLRDFARFRASLAAAAPGIEERLATAIGAMGEGGSETAQAAAQVPPLIEAARDKLLPPEVTGAPAFGAARMASLLLDEGGVAESYEAAVEGEPLAYGTGYFALQRVKALWAAIAPHAPPETATAVGGVIATLDALFPGETAPEALSADPEEAEAPAQQLVGLIEAATDADLYPGRDLPGAADRVRDIALAGCRALDAGDAAIGRERLSIAAAYFGSTVADTLAVMAPEAGDAIAGSFARVEAPELARATAACPPLLDALAAGRRALGP